MNVIAPDPATPNTATPALTTTAGIPLPLTQVDIDIQVDGLGHTTTIGQTFANDCTEPIEAIYTFPLPGGAAVGACTIRIGERVLTATLKELNEARREYDEAIAEGRAASIVEKQASEVFELRVGNIEPGTAIEVVLTLHGEVRVDGIEATLRFPTLVAPRYLPQGTADEVVDTSAILRDANAPRRVDTHIRVQHTDGALAIASPSHLEQGSNGSFELHGIALDRDVILRWDVLPSISEARWVADPSGNGSVGTIELLVRVPADPNATRTAKDVVVLLDHSGSMGGWGQSAANATVIDLIQSLQPGDTIQVLEFDSSTNPLPSCAGGPVSIGSKAVPTLIDEVRMVAACGGTELIGALKAGAEALPRATDGRERVMVVITDGQFGDESPAVQLRNTILKDIRMIVVGIDMAVSGGFLDELAAGSYVELIESDARRAEVSMRICSRLTSPAFTGLQIDGITDPSQTNGADVYPEQVVRIAGRCPKPEGAVTLRDRSGNVLSVPVAVSTDQSIRSRWAAARLITMEHAHAPAPEIVALSLEHQVLCKHTAWVVVDREGKVLEGDPIPVMQVLDEPAGWALRTGVSYSQPLYSLAPDRVYARMSTALRGPDYALPSMVVGSMPSFRHDSFIGGWGDIATSLEDLLGEMRTTMVLEAEQAEQILELVRQFPRNERRRVQRLNLAALVGPLTPVSLRRIEKVLSDLIVIAQGLGTSDGIPF